MRLIDADHLKSMLQEYIKCEQAYIDIGNNTKIAIGHSNGLWEAIAQIDEEPTIEPQEERWIPCSERPPDDGQLIYASFPYLQCCQVVEYSTYIRNSINAWVPLPESYKQE